jgi:hypothetical protein
VSEKTEKKGLKSLYLYVQEPYSKGMNNRTKDARIAQMMRELQSDLADLVEAGELSAEQANEWANEKADQWAQGLS